MELDVLKHYIEEHLPCDYVKTNGDGRHFNAVIVSRAFEDLNTLKRQQKVYAFLSEKIASGELHAFTMKTYTPVEWQQQQEKKNG
jgi:acid stress-induced BolA-like protein IbaG/YrbA